MSDVKVGLVPGGKLNIEKAMADAGLPKLEIVCIGLGWDEKPGLGDAFDADAVIVLCDQDEKSSVDRVIYFGNLTFGDAVSHHGDNLTGAGDGDDETIEINFSKLPADVVKIPVYATIYEGKERKQNFGMLNNAFMRIYDQKSGTELGKLDLTFDGGTGTSLRFGHLIKRNEEWYFAAENIEQEGGVQEIGTKHGI